VARSGGELPSQVYITLGVGKTLNYWRTPLDVQKKEKKKINHFGEVN